jgi:hypothetical protein
MVASGGAALSQFIDFFRTTGPLILTRAEDVVNEATLRTYVLSQILGSSDMFEMLQGGETIRDDIFLEEVSSYEHYHPNDEFDYENPQVVTQWSAPWRFSKVDLVFTDHEIGLNSGDLNRGAKFHQFKRLKRIKEQNMWTSLCNGMENDLFATPNNADMEAAAGKVPYSLGVGINQFTNTVPPGFTTVQGINPATETRWQNHTEDYVNLPAVNWDLFPAFSRMYYSLRYEQMPKMPSMGEATSAPGMILCGISGITNYETGLRLNQDTFVTTGRQDPAYARPGYRGIPLVYIDLLDQVALYPGGSGTSFAGETDGLTDRNGTALALPDFEGPRYWWITPRYLRKVVNNNRFLHEEMVQPSRQPFTRIMVIDTWHNNIFRSRQRHGIVGPLTADLT